MEHWITDLTILRPPCWRNQIDAQADNPAELPANDQQLLSAIWGAVLAVYPSPASGDGSLSQNLTIWEITKEGIPSCALPIFLIHKFMFRMSFLCLHIAYKPNSIHKFQKQFSINSIHKSLYTNLYMPFKN